MTELLSPGSLSGPYSLNDLGPINLLTLAGRGALLVTVAFALACALKWLALN